jgi:hypothetical protein
MTAATRRAALTALASASALAIPAVAMAAPDADAEILALGAEFDRLMAILGPLENTYKPLQLLYRGKVQEIGVDAADAWEKQSGFWAINDQVADVGLSMGSLVERMIALRPKTLAGVVATAR